MSSLIQFRIAHARGASFYLPEGVDKETLLTTQHNAGYHDAECTGLYSGILVTKPRMRTRLVSVLLTTCGVVSDDDGCY